MATMTSTEFRKGYARLTTPTVVTVNGHTIGVWYPGTTDADAHLAVVSATVEALQTKEHLTPKAQQAERDRILRAVNKG